MRTSGGIYHLIPIRFDFPFPGLQFNSSALSFSQFFVSFASLTRLRISCSHEAKPNEWKTDGTSTCPQVASTEAQKVTGLDITDVLDIWIRQQLAEQPKKKQHCIDIPIFMQIVRRDLFHACALKPEKAMIWWKSFVFCRPQVPIIHSSFFCVTCTWRTGRGKEKKRRGRERTEPADRLQEYCQGTRAEFLADCQRGKYNDVVAIYRSNESVKVSPCPFYFHLVLGGCTILPHLVHWMFEQNIRSF